MTDAVSTSVTNGVMTITMNRPEAKNAVNLAMAQGIAAAIDELDSNDDIRVGILTGANQTFCSGMDLKAFVSGEVPCYVLLFDPSPCVIGIPRIH